MAAFTFHILGEHMKRKEKWRTEGGEEKVGERGSRRGTEKERKKRKKK